jgi:hypothetical protein
VEGKGPAAIRLILENAIYSILTLHGPSCGEVTVLNWREKVIFVTSAGWLVTVGSKGLRA